MAAEQQKAQHDPIELRQEIERKLKALYELRARLSHEDDEEQDKPEPPPPKKQRVKQPEVGGGRAATGGIAHRSLSRLRLPRLPERKAPGCGGDYHVKGAQRALAKER